MFIALKNEHDFWDASELTSPVSEQAFNAFAEKYGYPVPTALRTLYAISNGGWTDYIYVISSDKKIAYCPSNRLPQIEDWEALSSYVQSFDLDDEDTLTVRKNLPQAHIVFRYGFEFFFVFWYEKSIQTHHFAVIDLTEQVKIKPIQSGVPCNMFFKTP